MRRYLAARLRDVIEQRADPVYQDPLAFFDNTYPTEGLRVLLDGLDHGDVVTHTLWGELAYQIGGAEGYALTKNSDQDCSAPGTGLLEQLVGGRPTLIMLDEAARHLRAAQAVPTVTGKSDLAEQTVAFLMSLFEFAASQEQVCVILTLADSRDAFGKEEEEEEEVAAG
ncbi:MAG TPA: DUF499 domain-containing protein [Chloroflexi bacterium]|nr:DUF499 domain-containing protein [Chloroflexota bacterium]